MVLESPESSAHTSRAATAERGERGDGTGSPRHAHKSSGALIPRLRPHTDTRIAPGTRGGGRRVAVAECLCLPPLSFAEAGANGLQPVKGNSSGCELLSPPAVEKKGSWPASNRRIAPTGGRGVIVEYQVHDAAAGAHGARSCIKPLGLPPDHEPGVGGAWSNRSTGARASGNGARCKDDTGVDTPTAHHRGSWGGVPTFRVLPYMHLHITPSL